MKQMPPSRSIRKMGKTHNVNVGRNRDELLRGMRAGMRDGARQGAAPVSNKAKEASAAVLRRVQAEEAKKNRL